MSSQNNAPAIPFTCIVPTIYGQLLVNRHDINQTNSLFKTGQSLDHGDILLLANVLQRLGTDATMLDVGANFGAYSIALCRLVGPNGKIHAFEPQRLIYNLLVGSVALNSITNVYCHNVALGDHEGRVEIPQFDYNQPLNFGSVEFSAEQSEPLTQNRGHDPAKAEFVPLTTIDRFEFPHVHLIKIDAEGMELPVLRGAERTIQRCRPIMYIEFLKSDHDALLLVVSNYDYVVYESKINFLCIPRELTGKFPVEGAAPAIPRGNSASSPAS
jgi:FkbM family methyltransferase